MARIKPSTRASAKNAAPSASNVQEGGVQSSAADTGSTYDGDGVSSGEDAAVANVAAETRVRGSGHRAPTGRVDSRRTRSGRGDGVPRSGDGGSGNPTRGGAGPVGVGGGSSHVVHPASLYKPSRRVVSARPGRGASPSLRHASYSQAVLVGKKQERSVDGSLSPLTDLAGSDEDDVDEHGNLVGFIDDEADEMSDANSEAMSADDVGNRSEDGHAGDISSEDDAVRRRPVEGGRRLRRTAGQVISAEERVPDIVLSLPPGRKSKRGVAASEKHRADRLAVLDHPRAVVPAAEPGTVVKRSRGHRGGDTGRRGEVGASVSGEETEELSCGEEEYMVVPASVPPDVKGKRRAADGDRRVVPDKRKKVDGVVQRSAVPPAEPVASSSSRQKTTRAAPSQEVSGGTRRSREKRSAVDGRKRRRVDEPARQSTPSVWSVSPPPSQSRGRGAVPADPELGKENDVVSGPVVDNDDSTPPPLLGSPVGDDSSDAPIVDPWLQDVYTSLPALPNAEAVPVFPQDALPSEQALLPSAVKDRYDSLPGYSYLSDRLFAVLNIVCAGSVYVNPSRADVNAIVPSKFQTTSVYFTIPKERCPVRAGALAANACFLMTGVSAYSNLGVAAVRTYGGSTTTDHRIGIYPFEYEYQRAFRFFAAVSNRSPLRYPFAGGVLAFSTRNEGELLSNPLSFGLRLIGGLGSGEASQNFGPSSTRSVFHAPAPRVPDSSSSAVALQHIHSSRFPPALGFTEAVPILDARRRVLADGSLDFTQLTSLPAYPRSDVNDSSVVTVGFTANTYVNKAGVNKGFDYVSLNVQFVVVHADSPSKRTAPGRVGGH